MEKTEKIGQNLIENISMISGWQKHPNLAVPKNKHFFTKIQQNISYPYLNKTYPYKSITFKNPIQKTFTFRKNQYIVKSIIDHFKAEPKKMIVKNAKSSCTIVNVGGRFTVRLLSIIKSLIMACNFHKVCIHLQ